jgi:hypothetical protein
MMVIALVQMAVLEIAANAKSAATPSWMKASHVTTEIAMMSTTAIAVGLLRGAQRQWLAGRSRR